MFKIDEIFFWKYLELSSKTMFDLSLRKLPSQYGEVIVMYCDEDYLTTKEIRQVSFRFNYLRCFAIFAAQCIRLNK